MNDNLQKLHANLGKIDPGFTRSYDEFSADMQDENKRRRLHTSLGKIDPGFTRTYDEFVSDMGFAQPAADTRPATPAKPRTQTFIENQTGEQHTVGEHDIDAFVKANPDIRVAADEEIDPSARAWSQPGHVEQRPVRRFDEAFKQGTKALVEGAKVTAANLVNQFTGSSRDAQRALEILEKHGNEKFNPREAFKKDRQEQYDSEMEAYRKNREKWGAENPRLIDRAKSMLRREVPKEPNNPFGQGRAVGTSEAMFDRSDYRPYKLVEEALKKGSIDDAKSYLSEKAQTPTWGDRVEEVASEKLLEQQPTEGIAAWVGNIAPQMVPNALAIAASAHPVTRPLARPLGMTGMGILSTASGGSAIAEARQYAEEKGIDVSESDVQKAGALATAIEIVTEIPPLEMYLAGAGRTIKTRLGKQVAKDIIDNPVARKEADELLKRVAKNIPGSLSKGTAANYLRQLTAEGLSEFVAEGSGTLVPLIYSEEEDYPELKEILLNGWEGAKAGFFMGAFLGGGSTLVNNRVQNQRRREQENVTFADTDAGIVEILGEKEDTYSVLKNSGEVTEIPKSAVKEWTTVNWSEFKQFSDEVAEESGKVVVNSSEIQQDAAKGYEILEAVVNPEIREDVDPMSSDSHIAARYQIALAEEQFDSAFEGSAAPFDKQHILTRDADEQKQILFEIFLDDSYTEEQHNAIAGLVQAAAINQKLIDQLSSMQEESLREQTLNLTKNVNEKTGTLVTGRIKDNDQPVAIIRGLSFDVNQEGAYIIDTETSDEAVYYIDAEGKTQVTTADMIEVEESMDVAEAIAELEQSERFARAISEQAINSEVDNLLIARNQVRAGQPSPGPWTIGLTATGPDGSTAQIIDFNEDGSITLDVEATDGSLTEVTVQPAGMTQYGFMQPETVTPESGNISPENEIISQETVENQPKSVENTPETEISDMETETIPPETEISPEEAERVTFMESLPIIESGKNQGQIDQRQMTPEQTLKYFEYQYGNERTLQAAIKQVDNMKKTLGREQKKLDNDPFNIEQTEKVAGIESELQIYSDYVNTARMAGIEEQMQRQAEQPTSVATDRQARRDAISTEEAGRVGTAAQSITEKWNDSEKVEGMEDVITLANGEKIPGRYVLTTSEAPSPSHDINRNFAKTEGFPTNDQGKTVNDRDYEADQQAQLLVQQRANNYDERAVQTPVVVSREGIVLSGNDRTMAGQIAARNGTDGAYVDYITRFAPRWGFTTEQVQAMPNPRVVFVPTIDLPYDTATFAKFNAEEKKTQSSLETAIKASKSVSRDAIIPLAQEVEKFDKLNDFYTTPAAVKNAVQILLNNGVIQPNEVARMMDGDALSAEGRSFFETLMLGSVLNEEALRQVDKMRSVRQTLMRTMPQLLRNASLSEYSLIEELNNAIHLLYDAKQSGSKVKLHLMQGNIFEATAEEIYSETEKLLSLMLEGEKDSDFRAIFDTYNARAIDLESGQADMFEGILDKPELLQRIISSYGQGQETSIEQAGSPAVVDRQGEESGTRSDTGSTSTDGQQPDTGLTESLPNRQTIEGNTQENTSDTDTAITDDQSSTEIEVSESQQKGEPAQPVDILDLANTVVKNNEIAREGEQVDPNPSEAQKQAGNYKKGHVNVQGFDITIENPAGSVRSGTDAQGNTWSVEMQNHYGYFKRTQGKDGDQIDVFVGPNPESGKVFVVDQVDPQTGVFDESKVMLGFDTVDEARAAYLSNYEEGWQGLGAITEVGVEDFKAWLYDGAKQRKAFSEYVENKPSNTSQTTSVFREEIDRLSKIFNTPVEVHSEVSTVTNPAAREAIESGRNVKGWYVDDKVHIYLPNAENVQDVQETFFHEAVAHKGIKDLLGENHRVVLESFFDALPSEVQNELLKRFGNKYAAADEFIATVAERGEFMGIDNRNLFQRIVDAIREFFSGSNIDIQLSTAERMANDMLKDSAERLRQSKTYIPVNRKPETFRHSDKSVTDYPQQAIIKGDNITVLNKFGRKTLSKFSIPVSEWKETYVQPTANINYNMRQLVKEKHIESTPGNVEDGVLTPIAERIVDSQVNAIKKAYEKLVANIELKNSSQDIDSSENSNIFDEKSGENETRFRQNKRKANSGIQLQLNWDEGALPFRRSEAIDSDPEVGNLQREKGYVQTDDNSLTFVERQLSDLGQLNFMGSPLTGPAKITSPNDIAFLFKNLESAATENAFAVLANKDGNYRVLYISTGHTSGALIDDKLILGAAIEYGATEITLVHNHPSGRLVPSTADYQSNNNLWTSARAAGIHVNPGIIINLDSGQYAEFDSSDRTYTVSDRTAITNDISSINVHQFDRLVLHRPSSERTYIRTSRDIAEFLSKQKRGTGNKLHAIILDRSLGVNRYLLLDANAGTTELIKQIISEIAKHGDSVALASNFPIGKNTINTIKSALNPMGVALIDVLEVQQDQDIIDNYKSFADEGLLDPEVEYQSPLFRIIGEIGASRMEGAEMVMNDLAVAREMEAGGKNTKSIRMATGWERGVDKKWRYEVPDSELNISEQKKFYLISEILPESSDLLRSYPSMRDMLVQVDINETNNNGGEYIPFTDRSYEGLFPLEEEIKVEAKDIESAKSILLHEIQHAIQEREGFAQGGSERLALGLKLTSEQREKYVLQSVEEHSRKKGYKLTDDQIKSITEQVVLGEQADDSRVRELETETGLSEDQIADFFLKGLDPYHVYQSLAGETEARNVQARETMTPEERRSTLLAETEDVARDDQIVLLNSVNDNDIRFRTVDGKEVSLFKYGEGGTKGVFQDNEGNLYKSLVRQENAYNKEAKKWTKKDVPGESREYEILKELQDNNNIVKVGEKIETTHGPMFEIERLNEIESLTYNEYNGVRDILKTINDKGYFVNDLVSVMRRPETNELVVVDFSSALKDESKIGDQSYDDRNNINRLKKLLSEEDRRKVERDNHNDYERKMAEIFPGYKADIRFREEAPAYKGQSIFDYAAEVNQYNEQQKVPDREIGEETSPRVEDSKPKYNGQPIADYAQETTDYNDANGIRFRVQLDKDGLPIPPVLHAGMNNLDIADLVTEFKNHTDKVFKDVNIEMAKISSLYTTFVDRARPLEKYQALMQEKGAKPGESVYWDYITSSSRATHLIQDYNKTRIEPLQESLRKILRGGKKSKLNQLPIYKWHIIDESTGEIINDKEISDYDRVSLYLQAKDIVEASTLKIADRGEEGFRKNVRDNKGDEVDPNDYIDEFEKAVGKKSVDDLWNKIRGVNKWALDLQLEYGLIDSEVYAKYTDGTRQHYVPQRGWRERDIAGNKLYYTLDKSSGPDNPFNVALVKAHGRETLAGDPLAYMQSIGESTVMAALKNRTKQKFLDFAEANSDFARIHDFFAFKRVYYISTGKVDADGNTIYERTYEPPSQEQLDADKKTNKKLLEIPNKQIEARQNYIVHKKITKNQYDRLMKRLSDQERKLRNSINVRYADSEASRIAQVTAKERQQHNVIILRDGKEYEIQFSQNYDGERVANALNRNFGREVDGDLKFMQNVNEGLRRGTRFMSAMMTQYNPTFSVANFIRDWGIGSISNMAEFGLDYQLKFMKNTAAVQPAVWKYAAAEQWGMGKEYSDGYYGKMMKEFFEDGAATGWSFLKDIEQLRTDMKRAVDPKKSDFILHGKFGLWNAAGLKQAFGMLTEASELTTRFAEYVTSREMKNPDGTPRFTREEAAIHAKEISVNFDRKGNQKFFGTLFSFFNATIQGTNKLFRMIRNPKVRNRMIGISAMLTAGGILQAMLMPDPDDDDDRMFTEWELMQNLCLGKVKIPLPQGLRAFWGFGTQMGLASRGMKGVDSALLEGTHYFFGELIPEQLIFWANGLEIDDTTDQLTFNTTMAVRGAIPTTMQPMYDVWQNTNFMGGTSYRTEFTNALADTKAERSLGKRNVSEAAQKISDKLWVWGGGDIADDSRLRKEGTKVVPAFFDVNPSVIETLTRGYAAGTGKFVMDLVTLGIQIADPEKEVDVSRMAIANVLWKQPRDFSVLESKLWKLSDKTSFYKTQYNEVKKNNPERYKRITSFHANSGQLGRRDPVEFQHRLWRDGTDENKMFGLIQMSEMLQKRIDAGLIGGEEAERQVDMLLLKFEELQ